LDERIGVEIIVGVGVKAKRDFGIEIHTKFKIGARILGKGSCFHMILIVSNV